MLVITGALILLGSYVMVSQLLFRSPNRITVSLPDYPPEAAVCTGAITDDCALMAANRVGHDIAFVQTPESFRPRALLAFGQESIHELLGDRFVVSLYSRPLPTRVAGRIERRMTIDGFMVTVRRAESEISLEWMRKGVEYALAVTAFPGPQEPRLEMAVSFLRRAPYQEPSVSLITPHGGS